MRKNILWTVFWIFCALAFNLFVYYSRGLDSAIEFFTAYVIEKSLSIDNLFIFALIFQQFRIPLARQHRILYLGIIGALVMRLALILAGVSLIEHFSWMTYLLGAFLLLTGLRFLFQKTKQESTLATTLRKWFPSMKTAALALIVIEISDIIFAIDSIPAVFAITTDRFIVYTSNIFAILGLRSLYFILADFLPRFYYLKIGLAFILIFIGLKMIGEPLMHISVLMSLAVIFVILSVAVIASLLRKPR